MVHDGNLAEEISQLRRQTRWLKQILAVSVVSLPILFLLQSGASEGVKKEIVAENFVVMDGTHVRAKLGVQDDGRVGLLLNDQAGKLRALVGVFPNGSPSVALFNGDGKREIDLTVSSNGGWIRFLDRDGRARAGVSVSKDGFGSLSIVDQSGKIIWHAP